MSLSPRGAAWVRLLADRFSDAFPERLERPRTLGREAEFPLVRADGSAAEAAELWGPLQRRLPGFTAKREGGLIVALTDGSVEYTAEVGRGTLELIVGPEPDLHALAARHEDARAVLFEAADEVGAQVLGYGIQPHTPATAAFLTPKRRYHVLHEVIGEPWLWFTLTASDQVHLDLCRAELSPVTDLCNLLAPVTVALCANSPVFAGAPCGAASARELHMGTIHAGSDRHGMPRQADGSAAAMVERYVVQEHLLRWEDGEKVAASGRFIDSLEGHDPATGDGDAAWTQFLLHEHYIWNSARPRSAHATLELRAACQQPLHEHDAAAVLGAALIEGAPAIAALLRDALGADPWPAMRAWHHAAMRQGLAAPEPAPGLLRAILDAGRDALAARGLGEESRMAPLYARLDAGMNPAQRALAAFEAGGLDALVALAARR